MTSGVITWEDVFDISNVTDSSQREVIAEALSQLQSSEKGQSILALYHMRAEFDPTLTEKVMVHPSTDLPEGVDKTQTVRYGNAIYIGASDAAVDGPKDAYLSGQSIDEVTEVAFALSSIIAHETPHLFYRNQQNKEAHLEQMVRQKTGNIADDSYMAGLLTTHSHTNLWNEDFAVDIENSFRTDVFPDKPLREHYDASSFGFPNFQEQHAAEVAAMNASWQQTYNSLESDFYHIEDLVYQLNHHYTGKATMTELFAENGTFHVAALYEQDGISDQELEFIEAVGALKGLDIHIEKDDNVRDMVIEGRTEAGKTVSHTIDDIDHSRWR